MIDFINKINGVILQIIASILLKYKEIQRNTKKYNKIQKNIEITKNYLEVYKKQLVYSGLVSTRERGKMLLSRPRFKEFVSFWISLMKSLWKF